MKPTAFVASTTEARPIAKSICAAINRVCTPLPWYKGGVFEIGTNLQPSLIGKIASSDFVILILTADDLAVIRNEQFFTPRDNLIFEAGMAFGANEPNRTIIIPEANPKLKLPSDLAGFITTSPFERLLNETPDISTQAIEIRRAIRTQGKRNQVRVSMSTTQIVEATVNLVKQANRHIIMFGRDLSWSERYISAIEDAISKGVAVEIFCEKPNNATWQSNIDRLRASGAVVYYLPFDVALRLTLIDHYDPRLSRFVLTSKIRGDSNNLFRYEFITYEAEKATILWTTLIKLYNVLKINAENSPKDLL